MELPRGDGADLLALVDGAFAGERDPWANAANAAALVFEMLPDVNWAGFYFLRGGELVVGPFQGRVACVRIPLGQGVCGTAAERRETLIVPDVHAFPGHIACDAASNSEVVVPLLAGSKLIGVLDLDSPSRGRFTGADARLLESLGAKIVAASDWRLAGIDGF
jgi:L-methionine (R)-S-oxide reductase